MKKRTLDVVGSPSVFQGLCAACPRGQWCSRSWEQLCEVPHGAEHERRYWALQDEKVRWLGGVGPRPLPPVTTRPVLPPLAHILGRERITPDEAWGPAVGVYARNAVGDLRQGCEIRRKYLEDRGILEVPKILAISAEDDWLNRFTRKAGISFADSVRLLGFGAVIGPNFSAYPHSEHRVWLDNRAVGQLFMEFALRHGLPAVFHTYLEDSNIHQDWLVEYLKLNPTQEFLATGFDCKGGNNARFVRRRIRLLERVQERAGRPLRLVLHTVVTRIWVARLAWKAFPGRVHLLGRSLLLRSFKGCPLESRRVGRVGWGKATPGARFGMELVRDNAIRLEEAISDCLPNFFMRDENRAG